MWWRNSTARSVRVLACAVVLAAGGCTCDAGIGEASGNIEVNPTSLALGSVPVGEVVERFVEVRNTGNAVLSVSSIAISEGQRADLALTRVLSTGCDGTVRPEGDALSINTQDCARFVVRWAPASPGPLAAKVRIASDAQNAGDLFIDLTGLAVVPALKACVLLDGDVLDEDLCTDFTVSPPKIPTIDFGPAPLGSKVVRKLRLMNEGQGPLQVRGVDVDTIPELEEYLSLQGGAFTDVLGPGDAVDLSVDFIPQGEAAVTGVLVVPNNDPRLPNLEIPLVGKANGPKLCVLPEGGIDFGSVPVGTTRELSLSLENCGEVPYALTDLTFGEEDNAQQDYQLAAGAMPATPYEFAPGARLEIPLTYAPTTANREDKASFGIATQHQRGSIPVTGRGAPGACSVANTPTARIRVTDQTGAAVTTVDPLTTVLLDGSSSSSPRGGTLAYQWRLVSQPANGTVGIPPASASRKSLFVELAGDYVVELVVRDSYNCQSPPATVTVKGQPEGKLHIQLTWPQSHGDLDLHFVGPGGAYYASPGDVYYANPNPDWGRSNGVLSDGNGANDATLDIDDIWGNGPENLNHNLPFDGTFRVVVNHYCSREPTGFGYSSVSSGAVDATIKIYVNGTEQYRQVLSMTQRDKWEAATVTVSGGSITVAPGATTAVKDTVSARACTADTN
jgi:hypothetical protein